MFVINSHRLTILPSYHQWLCSLIPFKSITSLPPFNLVNGVGGEVSQVNISHEWNWVKALIIPQEITMHVELTHQLLVHDIMDSYNTKELYLVFDLIADILVDAFQEEEKELLMKKKSITMGRRLTGHYLLC